MPTTSARGNPIVRTFRQLHPEAAQLLGVPPGWVPGRGTRALILVGPNSSGKSVLLRQVMLTAKELGYGAATLSMALRTQGGMGASFAYGLGESHFGTGCNSAAAVLGLLKSVQGWQGNHLLGFDEPDIGLADEYALDMGQRLAEATIRPAPTHWGTLLASHSRPLLESFTQALERAEVKYGFLGLGHPEIRTVQEWFARPVVRRPLEELQEENITRFRQLSKLMEAGRKTPTRKRAAR